ncbi:MAG: hypothetical protein AAGP08_07605 [Pseudomonadota bacterium]
MRLFRQDRRFSLQSWLTRNITGAFRVIIAAYVMAIAVALFLDPTLTTIFNSILDPENARFLAFAFLSATALTVLGGYALGPVALMLAAFVILSRPLSLASGATVEEAHVFWRDLIMLGSLLIFAVMSSFGSSFAPSWRYRAIAPRRVPTTTSEAPVVRRTARPDPEKPHLTREDILSAELIMPKASRLEEEDDALNLFADVWDTPFEMEQRA